MNSNSNGNCNGNGNGNGNGNTNTNNNQQIDPLECYLVSQIVGVALTIIMMYLKFMTILHYLLAT